MTATGDREAAKRRAGEHAAENVTDGMRVGLGTGSTAAYAIRALGRQVDAGIDIQGVPTSFQARELAKDVGIPLVSLADIEQVDLAIDGADQIAGGDLLKGGGAAHTRERIVATAADQVRIVVDESKLVPELDLPVPVEIIPDARTAVAASIIEYGGTPTLREATKKDGPVVTDNGNLVLDCDFGPIRTPNELAAMVSSIPGVVDHGIFVGIADTIIVGTETDVDERRV